VRGKCGRQVSPFGRLTFQDVPRRSKLLPDSPRSQNARRYSKRVRDYTLLESPRIRLRRCVDRVSRSHGKVFVKSRIEQERSASEEGSKSGILCICTPCVRKCYNSLMFHVAPAKTIKPEWLNQLAGGCDELEGELQSIFA